MTRSGYTEDYDHIELYRATVERVMRGKRGQAFLRELAEIMDATPEADRALIAGELIDDDGCCCTIGLVCKSRGLDVSTIDVECPTSVGNAVGISRSMAAEIEFENDEHCPRFVNGRWERETPQSRWVRMRTWVGGQLAKGGE